MFNKITIDKETKFVKIKLKNVFKTINEEKKPCFIIYMLRQTKEMFNEEKQNKPRKFLLPYKYAAMETVLNEKDNTFYYVLHVNFKFAKEKKIIRGDYKIVDF